MKRGLFYALWLLALAAVGTALVHRYLPPVVTSGMQHDEVRALFYCGGALAGGLLFLVLAGLGWLPCTSEPRGAPVAWGWPQALWMVVQFFTMQVAAQIVCAVLVAAYHIMAIRVWHVRPAGNFSATVVVATAAGYLAAAAWSVWYIGRLGPARLRDGGPQGIGWRKAPLQAYLAAAAGLLLIGALAGLVQHVWPPSAAAVRQNPLREIFGTEGWKLAALFVLAAGVAPFVEEFVFRGGVFSALYQRFGTLWAALLTSLLFTAAHAQEMAHYLPGLILIGAVALVLAALRVRYHSIRPGIMLHVLFNGISVLGAALIH